jgi:hypothetical protein
LKKKRERKSECEREKDRDKLSDKNGKTALKTIDVKHRKKIDEGTEKKVGTWFYFFTHASKPSKNMCFLFLFGKQITKAKN